MPFRSVLRSCCLGAKNGSLDLERGYNISQVQLVTNPTDDVIDSSNDVIMCCHDNHVAMKKNGGFEGDINMLDHLSSLPRLSKDNTYAKPVISVNYDEQKLNKSGKSNDMGVKLRRLSVVKCENGNCSLCPDFQLQSSMAVQKVNLSETQETTPSKHSTEKDETLKADSLTNVESDVSEIVPGFVPQDECKGKYIVNADNSLNVTKLSAREIDCSEYVHDREMKLQALKAEITEIDDVDKGASDEVKRLNMKRITELQGEIQFIDDLYACNKTIRETQKVSVYLANELDVDNHAESSEKASTNIQAPFTSTPKNRRPTLRPSLSAGANVSRVRSNSRHAHAVRKPRAYSAVEPGVGNIEPFESHTRSRNGFEVGRTVSDSKLQLIQEWVDKTQAWSKLQREKAKVQKTTSVHHKVLASREKHASCLYSLVLNVI